MVAVAHATVRWFSGNRSESARQLGISTKRLRRLLNGATAEEEEDEAEPAGASGPTTGTKRPSAMALDARLRK
jgi:hypothetical protein